MKIIVICGHYGSGKTTFALNLALKSGAGTVLVDMDVVNPYFRSGDYTPLLEENGISVISPVALGTTVDAPFLSPRIKSAFSGKYETVIFDAGGDDAGATALGTYSADLKAAGYEMIYVINACRKQIANPADAADVLFEIERASRLKATSLCNNTHLCDQTTPQTIRASFAYAKSVSQLCSLPVEYTVVREELAGEFSNIETLFPVKRLVLPPW